jgi:hypothetical protein
MLNPAALLRFSLHASLALLVVACTITTYIPGRGKETRSREEFRQYVKEVFERQNQAVSELLFLWQDLDPADPWYVALVRAEADMLEACQVLNDIAVRKLDQRDMGGIRQRDVIESIGECDYYTGELEALLRRPQQPGRSRTK